MKNTDYIMSGKGTNCSGEVKVGWNKDILFEADIYAIVDGEEVLLDVRGRYLLKERNVWITLHDGLVVNTETPVVLSKPNELRVKNIIEKENNSNFFNFFKGESHKK